MNRREETVSDGAPVFLGRTYAEAFRLVLETRHYFADRGDNDVRGLQVPGALAYSVESMRLTTRLAHIMAWLLAVRVHHEGELSAKDLAMPEWRLAGHNVCLDGAIAPDDELPDALADLLRRSENLFRRVDRLDQMMSGERKAG